MENINTLENTNEQYLFMGNVNQRHIYEWVEELKTANKSPQTIKGYVTIIQQFSNFINKTFLEVDRADIVRFLGYKNVKPVTKQNRQSHISTFYNWMVEVGYVEKHPLPKWITIEVPERDRKYLTIEQFKEIKLFLKQQLNYKKGRQHYMLFILAFSTGLRASELVKLQVEDFNFEKNYLKTIGKGDKERTVGFHANLANNILRYLSKNGIETGYIFPKDKNNIEAGHITAGAFNKVCKTISDGTGIHLYPHLERHGYAMAFLDKPGTSLEVLKEQFGHKKTQTTMIYGKANKERLLRETNQSSPDPDED
jgi:site-specific recombinase XerD